MRPRPRKEELPEYTAAEIKNELEQGAAFKSPLGGSTAQSGKKSSRPDDLMKLFGIYDSLGLPPEVILLLITHCTDECHRRYGPARTPTMRYIEKAAYTWEREGIFSIDAAEDYLKRLSLKKVGRMEIKAALQIKEREMTASEQRYGVDAWIEMGFSAEAVEIAYDRTVLKTGKPRLELFKLHFKKLARKTCNSRGNTGRRRGPPRTKQTGKEPACLLPRRQRIWNA